MVVINNKKLKYFFFQLCIMFFISYILSSDLVEFSNDMKDMYLYYFSYQFIGQDISLIHIITSLIPTSLMISMFIDSLSYELDKNAIYIFTRTNKKSKWLLYKLLNIFVKVSLINFFLFVIAFLFFWILGFEIVNFSYFINLILKLLLLVILTQYILIIISNLISIKFDSAYGYIISNLLYIISILNLYFLSFKNINLIKYIPFTQHVVSIQDNMCINRSILYFSKFITGYKFSNALIYDILIIIIIILFGIKQINKTEFY